MKLFEFIRAMIFAIPMGIFISLLVLLYVISAMKVREFKEKFQRVAFFYLSSASLASVFFMAFYYYPDFFNHVDFVYCGAVIYTIILFHRILYLSIGLEKRFSPFHYIVPAIVVSVMAAIKLLFPECPLSRNSDPVFCVILIFSVYYVLLSLYEMHRFYVKLSIAYGTIETINHFKVIFFILETMMYAFVFGLFPFIGGQHPGLTVSLLLMALILTALTNNIPLVYSIIRYFTLIDSNCSLFDVLQWRRQTSEQQSGTIFAGGGESDYKQINKLKSQSNGIVENERTGIRLEQATPVHQLTPTKRTYHKYTPVHRATGVLIEIDKVDFENYFRKNKPYLNPYLTIYDLVEPLQCNRTYLSKFINRVYGMNFSNYINTCRLREMDRLLGLPGNRHKTPESLYSHAGFSSYRNYLNAKKLYKNDAN